MGAAHHDAPSRTACSPRSTSATTRTRRRRSTASSRARSTGSTASRSAGAEACTAARRSSRWPTPCYDLDHSRPAIARFAHVRPSRVVACETPEQVAEAIRTSDRIAIRGGGHCFAGRSTTTGTLIDVSPIDHVRLDGELATIGAGARLGAIYDALAAHGRTLVAGCGPTVGIAGLTLGGGIGILGRMHGLTCDQLVAAQVVLADGRIVHTDDHPDLLWALRGAGGGALRRRHGARLQDRRGGRMTVSTCSSRGRAELVAQWQRGRPTRPRRSPRACSSSTTAPTSSAPTSARATAAEQLLARVRRRRPDRGARVPRGQAVARRQRPGRRARTSVLTLRVLHAADRPAARLQARLHAARRRVQRPSRPTRPPTRTATRASACTSRPPTRRRSTA